MKTSSLLVWPLFVAACGAPPMEGTVMSTAEDPGALRSLAGARIVHYNVENLFDTIDDPNTNDNDFLPDGPLQWTADRYALKLERLAQAIAWSGQGAPPIVGLVEVENRGVVEDLAATPPLADARYIVVHHDSPDERGIDAALLVSPAHARVRSHEALRVDLPGGDRTRDVLYAELELAQGAALHVLVNHWPSRRDGEAVSMPKRMAAAHVVRKRVNAILDRDPDARVLIMGDMNDGPTDRSVAEGLGAVCDPSAAAHLYALMCIDQPEGQGSYNYQGEWSYLDQFIVSRALLDQVDEAKAYWDDRLLFRHPRYGRSPDRTYAGTDHKGGYSDHLPVVLQLR